MSKPVPPSELRDTPKKTSLPSTSRASPQASEHLALELSILGSENALKPVAKDADEKEDTPENERDSTK